MYSEDFVTYEHALALMKLGFREECLYHYGYNSEEIIPNSNINCNGEISINDFKVSFNSIDFCNGIFYDAPTLSQAQKWLRKEKGWSIDPVFIHNNDKHYCCYITNMTDESCHSDLLFDNYYDSSEEALSAGITECLKLFEK